MSSVSGAKQNYKRSSNLYILAWQVSGLVVENSIVSHGIEIHGECTILLLVSLACVNPAPDIKSTPSTARELALALGVRLIPLIRQLRFLGSHLAEPYTEGRCVVGLSFSTYFILVTD